MKKYTYLILWTASSIIMAVIGPVFGLSLDRSVAVSFGVTVMIALGDIAGNR